MAETPNPYKHRPGDERLVGQVEPCTFTEADEDDSDRFMPDVLTPVEAVCTRCGRSLD